MSNGIIIDVVTNTGDYSLPIQIIKIDENEQPIIVQPVQSFTDNLLPVEINVDENHQPIFIQTSEYYAPVQSVNGKIGFVTITLDDFIENVVYTTGDQTISGLKTFTIRPTVNGTGILLSGEATAGSVENVVYTTGDQTISGIKIFATGIDIFNATSPQRLRIFNSTGINSGEFATFGWQVTGSGQPNALVIGTQATQSGTLRDLIITGRNIAIRTPQSGTFTLVHGSTNRILTDSIGRAYVNGITFWENNAGAFGQSFNANNLSAIGSAGMTLGSNSNITWTDGIYHHASNSEISLRRNGPNILGLQNSTSGSIGQQFRVFNITGTNTGEFGLFGWKDNNLIIGAQATQSGTLRDLIITGNNINISSSGNVQFNNRPTVNGTGVLLSGEGYPSNNPSGFITGIVKQTKLFDYSISGTNTFTYIGSALVGSSQNSGVWKIYRSQIDQNGIVISNLLAQNIAWTGRFSGNYM